MQIPGVGGAGSASGGENPNVTSILNFLEQYAEDLEQMMTALKNGDTQTALEAQQNMNSDLSNVASQISTSQVSPEGSKQLDKDLMHLISNPDSASAMDSLKRDVQRYVQ